MTSFNKQIHRLLAVCLLALPLQGFSETTETEVQVEEILIPLTGEAVKAKQNGPVPVRGMSMNSVKEQYGEAKKIHPKKGTPPITRWDYPNFSVYFESKSVIHTVIRSN